MEFNEKLQQFRKEKGLTQEQLAEELFVSRTAISKWENGKGFPNLDSLKNIASIFSVSIDELLSGEEIISLAKNENQANIHKIYQLIYGILDVMILILVFLPLFGKDDGNFIHMVSLLELNGKDLFVRNIYLIFLLLMIIIGIIEVVLQSLNSKRFTSTKYISIFIQILSILIFISSRQPYATALLFFFFLLNGFVLMKTNDKKVV